MQAKFRRVYTLKIGEAGGRGIEIKAPFHIDFNIKKDAKEEPNVHRIKIWNLAPATIKEIEKPDQFCVLYAGYEYEDDAILIAAGNIDEVFIKRDQKDVVLNVEFVDGWVAIRDTAVSLGYGSGISAKAIIKEIAKQMGIALMMNEDIPDRTWNNGFSFYGPAYQALHKVVRGTGLEWSIQNNTLQIIKEGGTTTRKAVVFDAESGLIGSPERIRLSAKEKKSDKKKDGSRQPRNGWRITSLLSPTVNPGDKVQVISKEIEGFFRVESVNHTGQFQAGKWQTIMELKDE